MKPTKQTDFILSTLEEKVKKIKSQYRCGKCDGATILYHTHCCTSLNRVLEEIEKLKKNDQNKKKRKKFRANWRFEPSWAVFMNADD